MLQIGSFDKLTGIGLATFVAKHGDHIDEGISATMVFHGFVADFKSHIEEEVGLVLETEFVVLNAEIVETVEIVLGQKEHGLLLESKGIGITAQAVEGCDALHDVAELMIADGVELQQLVVEEHSIGELGAVATLHQAVDGVVEFLGLTKDGFTVLRKLGHASHEEAAHGQEGQNLF